MKKGYLIEVLEKSLTCFLARRKLAKKRSLHVVNEHFEPIFNAARGRIRGFAALTVLIPSLAVAWPWSRDMMNQPSIKPQEGEMPAAPARSVPVGGYPTQVKDRLHAYRLANPIPVTAESIARGKQFYTIFCTPCHANSGKGDGPVGKKFPVPPMDLTNHFIQHEAFDNWIYANITFGGKLMPSYRNDLTPEERWDVVNYIKHGLVPSSPQASSQQATQQKGDSDGIR